MIIRHSQRPDKPNFIEDSVVETMLAEMENDCHLNTKPILANDGSTGLHLVSFKEKHYKYLVDHPKVNRESYLANLRTMTKVRDQN
jgi:hypothetical protein